MNIFISVYISQEIDLTRIVVSFKPGQLVFPFIFVTTVFYLFLYLFNLEILWSSLIPISYTVTPKHQEYHLSLSKFEPFPLINHFATTV